MGVLGRARRERAQRGAAEEGDLHVPCEAMEAEEPGSVLSWARDAVEGRVPFDGLAHGGDGARDERVEAAADVAFPAWHGRDVGLDGGVAVTLGRLGIAAGEEGRLCGLICDLRGLGAA